MILQGFFHFVAALKKIWQSNGNHPDQSGGFDRVKVAGSPFIVFEASDA
jgi:hypothetical protein